MGKCRKIFDRIFIDGLSGMAQGLFATLIIGTITRQSIMAYFLETLDS